MDSSNHLLKTRYVLTLLRDIEFSRQILLFLKHNDPLSFLKSRFQADDSSHYLVNNYKNWDLALTETMKCWAISSSEMIMKISFSGDLKLTMCHLYHLLKPIGRKAASHFVINRYSLPSHDAFLSPGTSRVATLNCILMAYIKFSTEFLWLFEIVVLLCLLGNIIYSWRVLALFIGIKLRVPCF